jgi:hypothetical protein
MFMPLNIYMIGLDCMIITCCFLIAALAWDKSRLRPDSAKPVALIGAIGMLMGVLNLLLDMHWLAPPIESLPMLFAVIQIVGGSKGLVLGLMLGLLLFKKLRSTPADDEAWNR